MKLIPNWRAVLARAWSVHASVLTGAVIGIAAYWPAMQAILPVWAYVAGGVVITILARIIDQGISSHDP